MGKPINVSNGNYSQLDNMRRLIPGKKAYESFNTVITRLLNAFNTSGGSHGLEQDIHTEAEED